jgi:hypothetical protein
MITATLQSLNWGSFHRLPHMTVVTDVCVCVMIHMYCHKQIMVLDYRHRAYSSSDHFNIYKGKEIYVTVQAGRQKFAQSFQKH